MKIYSNKQIEYVKTLNNRGFTIVEMLYAFSIFLIIVSFFPLSFKYVFQHELFAKQTKAMEWHVFKNQLKKELRMSERVEIDDGRIILRYNGQAVLYEKYGGNLRRRVDYKGNEIVLQHVESVQFEGIKDGINMTVKDQLGQIHHASLYSFIELEVSNGS